MKKKLLFASIATVFIAAIAVIGFSYSDHSKTNSFSQFLFNKNGEKVATVSDEKSAGTSKVGGSKTKLSISEQSSEADVIQAMHEMTHQKVKADQKWGAVPLTANTAEAVYTIVENSDFKHKDDLLKIASRWKKADFSEIVSDHNYFWGLQGGTIGKAYGKLSKIEEQTFVLNNFGEEVAQELKKEGAL